MLNFITGHLSKYSADPRQLPIYLLMVQLVMEYACVLRDLHYQTQVSMLEKAQRHAAKWVLYD